jgi:hypothetical protein
MKKNGQAGELSRLIENRQHIIKQARTGNSIPQLYIKIKFT